MATTPTLSISLSAYIAFALLQRPSNSTSIKHLLTLRIKLLEYFIDYVYILGYFIDSVYILELLLFIL